MDPAILPALFAAIATMASALITSAGLVYVKLREIRLEERRLALEIRRWEAALQSGKGPVPISPGSP